MLQTFAPEPNNLVTLSVGASNGRRLGIAFGSSVLKVLNKIYLA